MDRKPKEDSLSIEDKLKAALVPDDEQPYPLPGNWVWTTLGTISDINMGQSPAGVHTNTDSNGLPLVGGPADMGDVYPTTERFTSKPTKTCKQGDNIISVRATIGRLNIADKEYCLGRGVAGIRGIEANQHFIKRFLETRTRALMERGTGTTFLQISKADIAGLAFPLPPLPEQRRIAEKLESLLGKVKEAKTLLNEILEIIQNFRQTVLAAAYSGRLTADWRKANPKVESAAELLKRIALESKMHQIKNPPYVTQDIANKMTLANLPDTWAFVELGKICKLVPNRNPEKEKDILFKYIDISSISNLSNTVIEMKEFYGSHAPSRARRSIQKDDILFSTVRTYLKNIAMVTQDEDNMLCSTGFCVIRLFEGLQPHFIFYLVLGDAFINSVTLTQTGTSYPATSDKKIFSEMIALPPLSEQEEIVCRVESLFSKVDELEAQYKEAMELIETLPEIILSKAFRGELAPQAPNDEPASVLLKRIIEAFDKKEPIEIFVEEVVMVKDKVTIKKRIPLFDVLKEANDWLSTVDLLHKAGYPRDADPDTIEDFYQQLKQELKTLPRIERERRKENDYFRALL